MIPAQTPSAYDRPAPVQARPACGPADEKGGEALLPCRNKVFSLCLRLIGNSADALDLTQDTFAKALAHYPLDHPEHVQAWILRIARNLCLDHLRRRKNLGPQHALPENAAGEWQTPEDLAGSQEDILLVRNAIAKLPPRLREVLVMREYGELSCHEIGRALNLPRGTVTSQLNRARQAVSRSYQEEHHDRCVHPRPA